MKIRTLLKGPFLVNCGYGVHSIQILEALLKDPVFDVYIENINWGICSFSSEENARKKAIKHMMFKYYQAVEQKNENWDLFIHITVPQEFERRGKFNVGVSAMVETDRISPEWVKKINEMDLIIVPSEHSKKVAEKTTVEWTNQNTGEHGEIKVNVPVVICNEGVDTKIFKKLTQEEFESVKTISSIKFDSSFNFLHTGQWGKGGFGEDRKNIAFLIKYFIETFLGRKDVGLVLKINAARNSVPDYNMIVSRIEQIKANFKSEEVPPIYLLHANLTNEEMSALYNHPQIKCFISLTHGEGFGLPLVEAASCGLPIIATNWSGHLDFLKQGLFSAIKYEMKNVPEEAIWEPIIIKDSRWAEVDEQDTKHRMKKMVEAYSKPQEWAFQLMSNVQENFDLQKVQNDFCNTIKQNLIKKAADKINPLEYLQSFVDNPNDYNVLYTMPMSSGDVYISSAVIDGLIKTLPKNSKIYFATKPEYVSILQGNKQIYKVIPFSELMTNVSLLEEVFDVVFTPNLDTQLVFSNWVRKGQGKLLAEQFAKHCECELGEYFIEKDYSISEIPDRYMTFHPGSGKEQWEARNYLEWQEVIDNLKNLYPDLKIIQVGQANEPKYEKIDVDLRGKTSIHQLAAIIEKSQLHLSIDTFTMHLAAGHNVPFVALFGSSHAKSTGPWVKNKDKLKYILLEANDKMGCKKACYKYQCIKNRQQPCINEIDTISVVESCSTILDEKNSGQYTKNSNFKFERIYPKISGYTTVYNAIQTGFPFIESIKSMCGFCDQVVVVDGCSTDGTFEKLQDLAKEDSKIQVYQNEFDWTEPGVDGIQKAFARAFCTNEFLWQQDADECVSEEDYEKIKMTCKRFPPNVDIIHLPVIELWGNDGTVTGRRHSWKWRLSRNKPEITHAINKYARTVNEKTGKVYAKKGMSDGCEYVNVMTYDMIPHVGFYTQQIESARQFSPQMYGELMNKLFEQLPSVFHYSWIDLPNKINQLKKGGVWDRLWSLLYQEETQDRFSDIDTQEKIVELSKKLFVEGGEQSDKIKYTFTLNKKHPTIMKEWLTKINSTLCVK